MLIHLRAVLTQSTNLLLKNCFSCLEIKQLKQFSVLTPIKCFSKITEKCSPNKGNLGPSVVSKYGSISNLPLMLD